MSERKQHWEQVYETKAAEQVSWFQEDPAPSLAALERHGAKASDAVVDVGGGASRLAGRLVAKGFGDVTVLDIAEPALAAARARLGDDAARVHWIAADITTWQPERRYDIWHDRAVFHFLTETPAIDGYLAALRAGLKPGGLLIMATFALDGPEKCSGLPVQR